MAITTAITDLFKSFYELIASFFGTAYALIHSLLNAIFGFISGLFTLAGDILGGFVDITTGVGKFVVGNIVLVAVVAAGGFLFVQYTAQGKQLKAKKTN